MIIAISGTPGCGKTTLSKRLSTIKSIPLLELSQYVKGKNLETQFDTDAQTLDVDIDSLNQSLITVLKKETTLLIDGHFSHDIDGIEGTLVCTCEISELNKRLLARGYSKQKIRDNLDAEIFCTCQTESEENGIPTVVLDCTKPVDDKTLLLKYDELLTLISQTTK